MKGGSGCVRWGSRQLHTEAVGLEAGKEAVVTDEVGGDSRRLGLGACYGNCDLCSETVIALLASGALLPFSACHSQALQLTLQKTIVR